MKKELTKSSLFTGFEMDRRRFIDRLIKLTGSTTAALMALKTFGIQNAHADIIAKDDERLFISEITYPVENGNMKSYLACPKEEKKYPAVIVVHENRGLNDHIRDVTRRMALEGFLTIAPDALSPVGGTPDDPKQAGAMIRELDSQTTVNNFTAAVKYLKTHPKSNGKVGITGFCWGGGMTNQVAVNAPELDAAVPYYGPVPEAQDVPKINASLLMHYGGEDNWVNGGIAGFEEALKKAGKDYQYFIYEGAQHAFNNDTMESRYNKEAADLAWKRTVEFFKAKLST